MRSRGGGEGEITRHGAAIMIGTKARSRSRTTNLGRGRLVLGCNENDRFWVDRCGGATISPVVRSG